MDVEWLPIATAPTDGAFSFLARGERVTFGCYEQKKPAGWLSWDGGFTRREPPTHWAHCPFQGWYKLRDWTAKQGYPAPP